MGRGQHVSFGPRGTQVRRLHAESPQHTMCGCVLGGAPPPRQSIGDADVCPASRQPAPARALLVQTAAPLLVLMQGECLHVGGLLFRGKGAAKKECKQTAQALKQSVGVQDNGRQQE